MEFGDTLAIVNLAGLIIVAFIGWTGLKAAKQQLMELMNRDLAEVRRQIRTSMKGLDRVQDHVADNREDILKIEVNIASMQDELESMSRKLDDFLREHGQLSETVDGEDGDDEPPERRHLYE
jgi:septal ring factor EnvC (AmiA/AmiB activator)